MSTLERTDVARIAAEHDLPPAVVRQIGAAVFWSVCRQRVAESHGAPEGLTASTALYFADWFGIPPADLST